MKRQWLRQAGWPAAVLLPLGIAQDYLLCRPNRTAFIGVMGDLRMGMTDEQVARVLQRHGAARLTQRSNADGFYLLGQTGLARWWQMGVVFREGRLSSARVSTEDGPYHPPEVPPDILSPAATAPHER